MWESDEHWIRMQAGMLPSVVGLELGRTGQFVEFVALPGVVVGPARHAFPTGYGASRLRSTISYAQSRTYLLLSLSICPDARTFSKAWFSLSVRAASLCLFSAK